ncbi:hypothetical protein LLEC1_07793 [Akanthomyces lecanii]|uniref:Major facilitator superfamily (MFS) profile domain-containing protein n=1 Tax=Cordyceps confragosa TaxID=2714763 RepID=A0A179I9U7_CORDF|nr:hypothetical protein LLEC1_07793 [Akanthomyces lecanii]
MMPEKQNEKAGHTATEANIARIESPDAPTDQQEVQRSEEQLTLHGPQLWTLIAGLYLGLYLLALELTMLSTVIPTLTSEFHTVSDISWYEAAYVVTLCVFIPLVGRLYEQLPVKHVYLAFMLVFEAGLVICATATTSSMFIVGRAVNGLGSSVQFSGTMLMLGAACPAKTRPLVTAAAVSMISAGAGASFWMLLPMGGVIIVLLLLMRLPEPSNKPPVLQALKELPARIDLLGFVQFAGAITMLLLALTWGGSTLSWSSPTIIGLLCGGFGLLVAFGFWIRHKNEGALITPACLRQRSICVGGLVVCLQGGASQAVPFYLPLWFQAIKGDDPSASAVHLLPSLVTMVVALITFGALVRKFQRVPPWAIVGSDPRWATGSGIRSSQASVVAFPFKRQVAQPPQRPVEFVPAARLAMSMSVISLFMQLGIAVSVSASQTIFANQLPGLLHEHAPNLNVTMVQEAGAAGARNAISAQEMPGFLTAYNQAVTEMFYFPMAACALAAVISFGLEWKKIGGKDKDDDG